MISHKNRARATLAALCVALILCCTFAVCLPHSHSEYDFDCVICAASKLSGDALLYLAPILSMLIAFANKSTLVSSVLTIPTAREGTPVWLKDKLSN